MDEGRNSRSRNESEHSHSTKELRPCPRKDRRNIVVIADEAHRSQYDFIDGFAKHMRDALPKASFIGFTGTPIESGDKNTQAVFGDLGCHNSGVVKQVQDLLNSQHHRPAVTVEPGWYY